MQYAQETSIDLLSNCSILVENGQDPSDQFCPVIGLNEDYQLLTSKNVVPSQLSYYQRSKAYMSIINFIQGHFAKYKVKLVGVKPHTTGPNGELTLIVDILNDFVEYVSEILQDPTFTITGTRTCQNSFGQHVLKLGSREQSWKPKPILKSSVIKDSENLYCSHFVKVVSIGHGDVIKWDLNLVLSWAQTFAVLIQVDRNVLVQKLFENESTKDLEVVAGNGMAIKCHRLVFTAHSPVLEAMVSPGNGMIESQTGRIEMKEYSEEGLNLFIRFLYGMELDSNDLTCDLALELLQLGHKYDLKLLEEPLRKLFIESPKQWFNIGCGIELYFFVRNLDGCEKLQECCKRILKSFDTATWLLSEKFQKLEPQDSTHLLLMLLNSCRQESRKVLSTKDNSAHAGWKMNKRAF